MELEGVVRNGVIVPDEGTLPEGARVRISIQADEAKIAFGERYAQFKGVIPELPTDLASQHDHYRLGNQKR